MGKIPLIAKRDISALIRNFLMGESAVTNIVGDFIRTEHAINPDADLSYPLVILDLGAGQGRYQGGMQNWSVDIYSYSDESQDAADTLYDAIYLALQAQRLWDSTGTISAAGSAREVSRPESGYNEQTRAWFARGTWVIMAAG